MFCFPSSGIVFSRFNSSISAFIGSISIESISFFNAYKTKYFFIRFSGITTDTLNCPNRIVLILRYSRKYWNNCEHWARNELSKRYYSEKSMFNPFMYNEKKMVKHTLKILRCTHRRIFKLVWSFFIIMHESINSSIIALSQSMKLNQKVTIK